MNDTYFPPHAELICYAANDAIAESTIINLSNGTGGLGNAAEISKTDIRIEINL